MAKQIHQLTTASSVGASDYLAKDTGSVTNKVTISQIANFVVGTYTTLVAGATQTIKSAINAVKTQLTTLQNHTGLTSISGSGKSTISELLGNTSISSIGNGTVTDALNTLSSDISSLNSDLTNRTGYTYQAVPKASTFGAGTFNCNVFQYYKQAVVYLNVGLPSIAASTEVLMCTLPEGSRPSQKLNMAAVTQSGTPIGLLLQWYTDGRISVFPLSAVNGQFMRGTFVIPTA